MDINSITTLAQMDNLITHTLGYDSEIVDGGTTDERVEIPMPGNVIVKIWWDDADPSWQGWAWCVRDAEGDQEETGAVDGVEDIRAALDVVAARMAR